VSVAAVNGIGTGQGSGTNSGNDVGVSLVLFALDTILAPPTVSMTSTISTLDWSTAFSGMTAPAEKYTIEFFHSPTLTGGNCTDISKSLIATCQVPLNTDYTKG
jgi:hypothetical protein